MQKMKLFSVVIIATLAILMSSVIAQRSSIDFYMTEGNQSYNAGNFNNAIDSYTNAIELDSGFAAAWYMRANSEENVELYNDALNDYNAAININSSRKEFWNNKGSVLCKLDRYEDGIKCYNSAINLDQNDSLLWLNLGYALRKVNRIQESESALNKSMVLSIVSNPNPFITFMSRLDPSITQASNSDVTIFQFYDRPTLNSFHQLDQMQKPQNEKSSLQFQSLNPDDRYGVIQA